MDKMDNEQNKKKKNTKTNVPNELRPVDVRYGEICGFPNVFAKGLSLELMFYRDGWIKKKKTIRRPWSQQ